MSICLHHKQVLGNLFEQHATKCCGILKIHRRKTQGSKRITLNMEQQLQAKNFDVQPGHMLFHQCIAAYKNIINASSLATEEEEIPMDDTLNPSLETVGMSPVNLYGVLQHSQATSTMEKLDKVVNTYKSTIAEAHHVSKDVLHTSVCFWGKWCTVESSRFRTAAWFYEEEIENCFVSWEDSDTDTDPWQVVMRVCIKTIWWVNIWFKLLTN